MGCGYILPLGADPTIVLRRGGGFDPGVRWAGQASGPYENGSTQRVNIGWDIDMDFNTNLDYSIPMGRLCKRLRYQWARNQGRKGE